MLISTFDLGSEIHAENGEKLADIAPDVVVDLVRRQGYTLFRGFAPAAAEFEAFTAAFGTCADTRHVHYPESGAGLGFHAEDAYNPYRPDVVWFFCAYQGSDGGIPTGVVDGAELLDALPEKWREFSRGARIRFDRQWGPAVWRDAAEVPGRADLEAALAEIPGVEHEFLPDGFLHVGIEVPLVVRTPGGHDAFSNTILQAVTDAEYYGVSMADGTPVPAELLKFTEEIALARERNVGWHTGDVAVIDNLRMMHRRSEYVQKDRDLRARHGEDFFGTPLPVAATPLQQWTKSLIQGDVALPDRTGTMQPRS
jgi:hypothetical protein